LAHPLIFAHENNGKPKFDEPFNTESVLVFHNAPCEYALPIPIRYLDRLRFRVEFRDDRRNDLMQPWANRAGVATEFVRQWESEFVRNRECKHISDHTESNIIGGRVASILDLYAGLKSDFGGIILRNDAIKHYRQVGSALQLRDEFLPIRNLSVDTNTLPHRFDVRSHRFGNFFHSLGGTRRLSDGSLHVSRLLSSRFPRFFCLTLHQISLLLNSHQRAISGAYATVANPNQKTGEGSYYACYQERPPIDTLLIIFFCSFLLGLLLAFGPIEHFDRDWRARCTSYIGLWCCGLSLLFWFMAGFAFPWTWGLPPQWIPAKWNSCPQKDYQRIPHGQIVSQKVLTPSDFTYYTIYMANALPTEKQIMIIGSLCEGSSIRSIERLTGVHRDTIMRLGVRVGQGCTALMDAKMRNLSCERLEMDEIWGFVGKKEKRVREDEDQSRMGDVWTFCAIDATTKLVPVFKVGKRDGASANAFVDDVAGRMMNRLQISTDGLKAYMDAIEGAFGADVDYAQIVKTYGSEEASNNRRYSPAEFVSSEKRVVMGFPDVDLISTSYVERLNATTRPHMRGLTRLTLAFCKKWESFEAAVGLHFAYYNFVKRHGTLRMTPAMAASVTSSFLSVGDLVEAAA